MKTAITIVGIFFLNTVFGLLSLIVLRMFIETRYIPSSAMMPTFQINDRILVEKIKMIRRRPFERGEIVVFYPPKIEVNSDLHQDFMHVMGRLTGMPIFPNEPAFIKRIVGLPGDVIVIKQGVGVFVNGSLLQESEYVSAPPDYSLNTLGEIRGQNMNGQPIQFESDPAKANAQIRVPEGQLFVLGDNRNNSEDSHAWGFLPQERVIGRAMILFWRDLGHPKYTPVARSTKTIQT